MTWFIPYRHDLTVSIALGFNVSMDRPETNTTNTHNLAGLIVGNCGLLPLPMKSVLFLIYLCNKYLGNLIL